MCEIKQTVLSFVEEMNDWEHKMYLLSRRESGQAINHQRDREIIPDVSYEDYKKHYFLIFSKHCTERKRTYGGFPSGWARNGQYQGINEESITSVETVTKNRAELIAKGGQFPDCEFMFVLLNRNGTWLIDSAKTRYVGDSEWETHHI